MNSRAVGSGDQALVLTGLDGSNPLAFLAALGTLRTLTRAWPERGVKMGWVDYAGAWRPAVLTSLRCVDNAEAHCIALDALEAALPTTIENHPAAVLSDVSNADLHALRQLFLNRVNSSTASAREPVDWLSATRADLVPDATSQLQTVRKDYFNENLSSIIARTKKKHLQQCLFTSWNYTDALDNQSLHIDPSEDRRHAYQWHQPTSDPNRSKRGGMLGANRLAIEAFPLFQSVASGKKLSTVGFAGNRVDNARWTWPIWSSPLGCDELGSLLSLQELQVDHPDCRRLRARGITAIFRSRRILVGKTPNFTTAISVL